MVVQWNLRTRTTHDLKKQKGTFEFEGGGGVDVSDNGGRFWFLVTILKHKHLVREAYERERERLWLMWGHELFWKITNNNI